MNKFYESDSEARWWAGVYGRVILAIVLLSFISAGMWAAGVFTSGIKGRGEVVKQQNSGVNRVFQQQHFQDLYADYQATVSKIPTYVAAAANGDTAATTNLTGLRSHCADVASQYNQDSGKVLSHDPNGTSFKSADLPVELSLSTCQEK